MLVSPALNNPLRETLPACYSCLIGNGGSAIGLIVPLLEVR
jgi:hypothetical protein